MRLHDNMSSGNGYKVRLLLAQLGVPFERVEHDIDEDEARAVEEMSTGGFFADLEPRDTTAPVEDLSE
jgi:hypothetical protein